MTGLWEMLHLPALSFAVTAPGQGSSKRHRRCDEIAAQRHEEERAMTNIDDRRSTKALTPGDWNAFFGFGTNILTNMLTLTILLRFVIKMPDSIVLAASCRRSA